MEVSVKCQKYKEIIILHHVEALREKFTGCEELVAFMLAGAICFAEKSLQVECSDSEKDSLIAGIVSKVMSLASKEELLSYSNEFSTNNKMIYEIAIERYRSIAIPALGGYQTPCTYSEITVPKLSSKSHTSNLFSRVSSVISKAVILLKKANEKLMIPMISRKDKK